MRMNSFGWAVIVLAVTLTIWNVMEYREHTAPPPASMGFTLAQLDAADYARRTRIVPRYVEREVLIIGVAVAVWLIVGRRKIA
jgi:hypothetical protein